MWAAVKTELNRHFMAKNIKKKKKKKRVRRHVNALSLNEAPFILPALQTGAEMQNLKTFYCLIRYTLHSCCELLDESNEQTTIAKQASDAELHLPLNRHLYD